MDTEVRLATSRLMLSIGSLRCQAGLLGGPHMSTARQPPASFMARPIHVGHNPSTG